MEAQTYEQSPNPQARPSLQFTTERFADVVREAVPLMRAHAAELGLDQEPWPLQPDLNQIKVAQDAGMAIWVSVRDQAERMVGYALLSAMPSVVFKDTTVGVCEWIYLERSSRRTVKRLIRFCEDLLREGGCSAMTFGIWGAPDDADPRHPLRRFGRLLEKSAGYEVKQTIFWKDITEG